MTWFDPTERDTLCDACHEEPCRCPAREECGYCGARFELGELDADQLCPACRQLVGGCSACGELFDRRLLVPDPDAEAAASGWRYCGACFERAVIRGIAKDTGLMATGTEPEAAE